MMHSTNGHEVFLYAGPESDAECTEHIPCISEEERAAAVGPKHFVEASFDYSLPHWRAFNQRAIEGIRARAQPHDFICVQGGLAHKEIADAFPHMMTVEHSIGYGGTFAKYRIWESAAWQHLCWGSANSNPNAIDGLLFDCVIPGSFDPRDFPFRAEKDDYHLFMGRLIERKGYGIAVEACQRLGKRLIIAGQGEPPKGDHIEYVGVVGPEERGRLMSGAQALWMPSLYVECFGNVAVEAQLCGTPVIATPFGAATETVEDGKTGFRCHTLKEFMAAADAVRDLDPHYIRDRAVSLYSTDTVAQKYQTHFERLATLWGDGFYAL
jgi:glycosyltransferase involved in cell wall biosynthesis